MFVNTTGPICADRNDDVDCARINRQRHAPRVGAVVTLLAAYLGLPTVSSDQPGDRFFPESGVASVFRDSAGRTLILNYRCR